ncbi:DNA polymerase III subunit alpha [Pseudoalteromonas sp. SR44-5]|uniref:DNA polymerase III subunit alpha n=1 Tax=Pseudoalteromonas rhizosphaerae TaxID=2518973 RepID=A0ABW8L1S6_9GAMM|nr:MULTISPECIES: DNA polymerase III subunit alpha [unclassified Pseudoalteromonas]MBB1334548.1 DNA polymerase III subunit alpha [Pseudoalteromonas sp. SR41-6]MBB1343375.1 DNA polymerase III subunit alpha [Pseudoalteromonas sp. SR45-6]MBB1367514.1 DNA polymerase III subunit alpha [Pseudoalteromonas sp. SR44-5]MBB1418929.1 DNA polymerase III subunit alpha [Pseudoalteromonas sp. SG44-1]MBB1423601.1 DNA polymerase III subunit alpha [Pseudoalteromonas sp. SG43-7]
MAAPDFVHLRVHSDFSMVDGLAKTKPIVAKAQELQLPALAITDQMNLCGLVRFYDTAHNAGIKPIVGADFWLHSPEFPEGPCRLVILAKDNVGYKNLTLLISKAYQRGHLFHRPVIERDWLVEHKEGLILLSGAKDGDLGKALLKGNPATVESVVSFYKQHFSDNYYIELIRTKRTQEEDYLHLAVELATVEQLPVVATNEVVFLKPENFEAHEIRVAIFDGYTLDDKRRPKRFSEEQYLKTPAQMAELFSDIPEALQNSVEIAKRCNVTVQLGTYFLPDYPTGSLKIEDFLVKVSRDGLEERLQFLFPDAADRAEKRVEYDERLQIELDVINQMGFPGYFLIVMEFIQWSKDNNIPVGPGRGSGAGSLVAYALKITDLDPLEFDLLFERFLNPERVSMPDFDVDFCMDRRDEVIDHVSALYGRDAVSQIITFGTMAAKAVIRDVGRVLGHPYGFVDRISKLIPGDPGMTLAKAFDVEPRLQEAYDGDTEVKDLIDMCRILEGCTRNAGKHAGGVVISPTTITDFAALYCDDEGKFPVTQFDKNDVETAGLVKFDFLGLRTLTILQWAVDMTNERLTREGKESIDINTIPLNDKKSIELLLRAETTAVFQLESRGMKDLVRRLKPDCFEDMIALVALFRPGPLQSGMVDNFIDRKLGREEISYPDAQYQHESLKPILEPTYGIILYQEQVMQIAQVLAGYTLGGADMLRRAMGKKKPEEMAKQRSTFEDGARNNGIDGELAIKIFDLVEKFAGYGFNKSHSAAYALVSYQTLWMKTHYPAEFMAAVMSADMDNTEKIVTLVDECENMKLTLLPPDVNAGAYKFTVNLKGEIVYGIGAIKGVGEAPVDAILEARSNGGPFKDLFDFCARVDLKRINKRVTEKLIYAGALDQLGPEKTQPARATLLASLKDAMKAADQHHKAESLGQTDLFGLLATEPDEVEQAFIKATPLTDNQWLDGEKETLGLYLTGHPINQYRKELKYYTSGKLVDLQPTNRDVQSTAAGLVIAARTLVNKKGNRWGLVTLDDKSARIDVRLFPEQFEMYQDMLQINNILVISGQVSFDNFSGGITMTARDICTIAQAREKRIKAIKMTLNMVQIEANFFDKLQKVLEPYKFGTCPIKVYYQRPDALAQLTLGTEWCVTPSDDLIHKLSLMAAQDVELEFN